MKSLFILLIMFLVIGCKEENTSDHLNVGLVQYLPPPDNCNGYVVNIDEKLYYPSNLSKDFSSGQPNRTTVFHSNR